MKYTIFLVLLTSMTLKRSVAQTLDLSNEWTYTLGTNAPLQTSKPSEKPIPWVQKDTLLRKTGMATFRRKVVIPSVLKATWNKTGVAALYLGRIQQADETFFNGVSIGKTPSSDVQRVYTIPGNLIKWDGENNIEIRVEHWGQLGGATTIPTIAEAGAKHVLNIRNIPDENFRKTAANKSLTRQLEIKSELNRDISGTAEAAYYNIKNNLLHKEKKPVIIKNGATKIPFTYNSISPFLKIIYTLDVPVYSLQLSWKELAGYEPIVYKGASPKKGYPVALKFEPAQLAGQKMEGWLGDRFLINQDKRLKQVDEAALLEGYVNKPGKHAWIGEHVGKFLEAGCNTYKSTADPALKIQLDRTAQQLIAAQKEDGYLGTYTTDNEWTSWDVWSHKYNLVGLLSYYELSGYEPALTAARKIGDLLIRNFGKEKRNIIKAGAHVGMAATSVIDPMTDLYLFTADQRYLDFCYYIVDSYNDKDGPGILKTLKATGRVDKTANGKAYEMMSNLVGLVKMYKLTGDTALLNPVLAAWADISKRRLYITGTTSSFEHFQDDFILPASEKDHIGEGCVTTTWIQFNYQLLTIFSDMKYVDELERAVFNHLTGAENPQTGCVSYYTPLMGIKPFGCNITCCMSSVPRGIAMIPLFANGNINGSPSFFFYQPGIYKTIVNRKTNVQFITRTSFPEKGTITIIVSPASSQTFDVCLRKPYWTTDFTVSVNGKVQVVTGTETMAIRRAWNKGDSININFTLPIIALDGGVSYPGSVAFQRGPQILVVDRSLNPALPEVFTVKSKTVQLADTPAKLPANWVGSQAFQLTSDSEAVTRDLVLVPYADAGQTGGTVTTWMKLK